MKKILKKVLVYLSIVAIVVQSLSPLAYLQLNSSAYAQTVDETIVSPTPEPSPADATVEQSTTPTLTSPTASEGQVVEQVVQTETVTPTSTEDTALVTPTSTEDTALVTPTSVDNLSPPISSIEPVPVSDPSSELQIEQAPQQVVEKECLTNEAIVDTTSDNWNIDLEKGTSETKEKVKLGIKYIFPQENKVSITFKCLPKDDNLRTSLKIQQIKVSDLQLPVGVNPYGEYAYDITTGMQDGNFEYEITLPKPTNQSVEIIYMEGQNSAPTTIDNDQTSQEGNKIKANDINHFTIFVVVNPNPAGNGSTSNDTCLTSAVGGAVTCYNTLQAAIDAAINGDTININSNISVNQMVIVNKDILINGNGSTISPTFAKTDNSNNATFGIISSGVTISNLAIDGTSGTNLHGINIYASTNVLLDDVSVLNNDRTGVVVNGSTVTVNNITTGGNGWHGINVDQGTGVTTEARLIISGISTQTDALHIYVDDKTKNVHVDDTTPHQYNVSNGPGNSLIYTLKTSSSNSSANLDQCANDSASSPDSPCVWQNGNLNSNQAHYVEGFSVPYRAVLSDLPTGSPITITLGYDIKHSDAHALDYLTHFNRLEPHSPFGHSAETIVPTNGVVGISGTVTTFSIPTPDTTNTPTAGQPATSFNSLPAGEKLMTLYGGTISNIVYGTNGDLTANQSETTVNVTFTPDSPNAVLAWGGHIAKETDWGAGKSAGGISGSPYHMRLIGWTLGNLGQQDRSLQAGAVAAPSSIRIIKDADPNDAQDFAFTTTGNGLSSFSLDDDSVDSTLPNSTTFSSLLAGSYSVTESLINGWSLNSKSCVTDGTSNTTSTFGQITNGVSINLVAGENVTCTFVNTKDTGTVTVIKDLIPSQDSGTFNLQINGTTYATGGDATNTGAQTINIGSVTVGETGASSTNLSNYTTSISCVDAAGAPVNSPTFTLNKNGNITCTITNTRKQGTIELKKVWSGTGGQVTLTIGSTVNGTDIANQITGVNGTGPLTTGQKTVNEGTYYANETGLLATYTPSTLSCFNDANNNGAREDNESTVNVGTDNAVFVGSAEHVICSFTNTRNQGTIELKKVWIGTPGSTTLNIGTSAGGSQTDTESVSGANGTTGQNPVDTGTYYVSETSLPDYTSSLSCTDNGQLVAPGNNDSVVVDTNHTVICTFTNTRKQGKIELQKDFVGTPENVTIKIGTSQNGSQINSTQLSADGTTGENPVNTGNYYVSETLTTPTNYTTALSCYNDLNNNGVVDVNNGDTSHSVNTSTGEVSIGQNDDVICVFTNTRNTGTIIVEKVMVGGTDTFSFTGTPNGSISSNNETISTTINTGSYTSTEGIKDGWDLTSVVCNDTNSTGNVNTRTSTFNVEADETVTCTFTNTKRGHVIIKKNAITDSSQAFTFNNNFGNGNSATFNLTDDSTPGLPSYDAEVLPGKYQVSEEPVAGWQLDSATCDQGETVSDIDVAAGETVTCTFTNEKLATITLVKNTSGGNASFDFDATGTGLPTDIDLTTVNGTASQTFENLNPDNTYTIAENEPAGWTKTSASCDNGDPVTAITPNAGEEITCTFENTRDTGTIELKKVWSGTTSSVDLNIGTTAGSYNIDQETGLSTNGTTGTNPVDTGTYYVSESLTNSSDYTSSLACVNATNNDAIVTVGQANSVTVEKDQQIVCTFTNTRQTGELLVHKFVDTDANNQYETENADANVLGFGWNLDNLNNYNNFGTPATTLNTGNYNVYEKDVTNYHFVGWFYTDDYTSCEDEEFQDTVLPANIDISDGRTTEITLCNAIDTGTVIVHKDVQGPNGENITDTSNNFKVSLDAATEQDITDNLTVTYNNVPVGSHTITESLIDSNYTLYGISSVAGGAGNISGLTIDVTTGTNNVYVTNRQKTGTITGTKWNDINGDSIRNCELFDDGEHDGQFCEYTEPVLGDWTIFLDENGNEKLDNEEVSTTTNSSGNYQFTVNPEDYKVCEVIKNGWDQTYPINSEYESYCYNITIGSGQTSSNWNFGNHNKTPILTIAKTNNALGDKAPGDAVIYTLTVTASNDGGPAENVTVTDLLPNGFKYKLGSWTSNSNERGDLKILGTTTEPTYASPGTWKLGNMIPGEIVTLTYVADINTSQASGTYYDNAWAVGNPVDSSMQVFAVAFGDGDLDTLDPNSEFVGTQVKIVTNNQSGSYNSKVTKEVLGAETYLPATGENTLWVIIATILSGLGLGSLLLGFKLRRKYAK